jgi:1,4-dihydroxy-2-naphthoyl-CoA synthase
VLKRVLQTLKMDQPYVIAALVTVFFGIAAVYSIFIARKKKEARRRRRVLEAAGIYTTITMTYDDKVALITLSRPRKKNAFSKLMYSELEKAIRSASANKEVSVIMLTGSGDYYSSGNDLSNFSEMKHPLTIAKEAREILFSFVDCFITCQKPIIVAVNGPAIG